MDKSCSSCKVLKQIDQFIKKNKELKTCETCRARKRAHVKKNKKHIEKAKEIKHETMIYINRTKIYTRTSFL
jgi:hypothetical protein